MQDADRPLRRMEVAARIQELRSRQAEASSASSAPAPEATEQASVTDPGPEVLDPPEPDAPAMTAAERIARMLRGEDG
jgi:hypothetical protein